MQNVIPKNSNLKNGSKIAGYRTKCKATIFGQNMSEMAIVYLQDFQKTSMTLFLNLICTPFTVIIGLKVDL